MRDTIDFHVHPIMSIASEKHLLDEMNKASVTRAVLLAIDVDPRNLEREEVRRKVLERLLESYVWDVVGVENSMRDLTKVARVTNEAVASMVRRHPNRFTGFGSVDICKGKEYVEGKLRQIRDLDLIGVKLIPTMQFFDPASSKEARRVWRFCEKEDMIITHHTGCDPGPWEIPALSADANPRRLEPLLRKHKTRVVVAHMGSYSLRNPGIWLEEALALGRFPHVWQDLAAVGYLLSDRAIVERAREKLGMDRVLFGSDYPAVLGTDIKTMVKAVEESPYLTDPEKEQVLHSNAARLLEL